MNCELLDRVLLQGGISELVKLLFYHKTTHKSFEVELTLPIFDGNVIHWRNSKKALMFVSEIQADADFEIAFGIKNEDERMTLHIFTPNDIVVRKLSEYIGHAIRNWFYGQEEQPDPFAIQISIDRWFANGEEWRVLKYSEIARQDQFNGIIIKSDQSFRSHDERLISRLFNPKLWDLIDINSTSFGDKANSSFRLMSESAISNNKIIKAPKESAPFCDILSKHAIGLDKNAKRVYLLRNTFEASIDLVKPEEPIVSPYSEGDIRLSGVNLITAIMHLEHFTHEDSIAISRSAADRLFAGKIVTQLIESDLPVTPVAKVGDDVTPDSIIALDGEKQVTASKLYVSSKIEEMNLSKGKRFGIETNRLWIKYRSFYSLETGDKISNRHGGKGVVVVLDENDMPWCPDTGEAVDICIGPESVINRKSMSVFWEMMLTRKAWTDNHRKWTDINPIHIKNFDTETGDWPKGELYDFETLSKTYGNKYQLVYKNKGLPELTFLSKMFWLRLDKIALEIVAAVKGKRNKNSFGALIDNAKASGQRCNAAKLLALSARKMDPLIADIIDTNMSGKEFFQDLIKAAQNKKWVVK